MQATGRRHSPNIDPGVRYIMTVDEDFLSNEERNTKAAKDIFGVLLQ